MSTSTSTTGASPKGFGYQMFTSFQERSEAFILREFNKRAALVAQWGKQEEAAWLTKLNQPSLTERRLQEVSKDDEVDTDHHWWELKALNSERAVADWEDLLANKELGDITDLQRGSSLSSQLANVRVDGSLSSQDMAVCQAIEDRMKGDPAVCKQVLRDVQTYIDALAPLEAKVQAIHESCCRRWSKAMQWHRKFFVWVRIHAHDETKKLEASKTLIQTRLDGLAS
ncbi:hypothetical protein MMC18_002198 [Xylographa bjoerkii]|nr:hypothetical protein [Xylographa bjoerkii]